MKTRPTLGQTVEATDTLRRQWRRHEEGLGHLKKWIRFGSFLKPRPIVGIYIGWRTSSNGYIRYDDGASYQAIEHFETWLVVTSDRKNPVHVLPEDTTLVERFP
jgi:hypothetical protein